LAAQCDYRVEQMARRCKVSRRQLLRFFREHYGQSTKHWLDERRARAAAQEIARGELVKTAASDLKFTKASSFTRFFKRVEGIQPKNYGLKTAPPPNGEQKPPLPNTASAGAPRV
jgi:AraC-like DNA-binding protein